MATHAIVSKATNVYFGPSSTLYALVGSIGAGEQVQVLSRENGYYCIIYQTSTLSKSGYVPSSTFDSIAGLPSGMSFGRGAVCVAVTETPVYYGVPFSGYQRVGTISAGESVTAFLPQNNGYSYVEYGTSVGTKRGYVETSKLQNIGGRLAYSSSSVTVYFGPQSVEYAVSGSISAKEYFIILGAGPDDEASWYFVEYTVGASRKRGYISAEGITMIGSGNMPYSVLGISHYSQLSSSAYVYAGPSEKYIRVGSVENDEIVAVLNAESQLGNDYRQIDYWTSGGRKRGYIEIDNLGSITNLAHIMNNQATVYGGPSTSGSIYAQIGSVSQGEHVLCIAKEAGTFLIEYISNSTIKRGYVAKEKVSNYLEIWNSLTEYDPAYGYLDYVYDGTYTVYTGPDATKYAVAGSLYPLEGVTVLDGEINGYRYIEYSSNQNTKRGYVATEYLQNNPIGIMGSNKGTTSITVYLTPYIGNNQGFGSVFVDEKFIVVDYLPKANYTYEDQAQNVENHAWYFIDFNTPDGRKRVYVNTANIELYTAAPGAALGSEKKGAGVYYATDSLTVKSGPSDAYADVGSINSGEYVSVFEEHPGEFQYLYIEYAVDHIFGKCKRGYVPRLLLEKINLTIPEPDLSLSAADLNSIKKEYGTSPNGHKLTYYCIGHGSKALVAVFAIHGYEDGWAADGIELVKIANHVIETMVPRQELPWADEWTLYVIPTANPDGVLDGYTHYGPGRTNYEDGIDMNRCFSYPGTTFHEMGSRRNQTGDAPLIPSEAQDLSNLLIDISSSHTLNLLDIHGWYGCYYGSTELASHFVSMFSGMYYDGNTTSGYLSNYVEDLQNNARGALIELPFPSPGTPSGIINNQHAQKTANAIRSILGDTD